MKYRELQIQTLREAPNNARTEGFSFLFRAGYLTREKFPTKLGEHTLNHFHKISNDVLTLISTIGNQNETFFPIATGDIELAHCLSCHYTERLEFTRFTKPAASKRASSLPIEKVSTPQCNSIESLANFLNIPKEKTAKALMYTRLSDKKFVFVVIRGDMQLSEAKLKQQVGDVRAATVEEIVGAGAVPGYASAIGLNETLIVVDNLIPESWNLVAGANEAGYHFRNTNYGRDYTAEVVTDLVQAREGDACINCGNPLSVLSAVTLTNDFGNILLALAETHHDEKGLTLPHPAAPFDVYLMHIPSKKMDTRAKAEKIYDTLQDADISVLFDDRDERAGVKFNDADLIGCPVRMTVGEKGLKDRMVELKPRIVKENQLVAIENIVEKLQSLLN